MAAAVKFNETLPTIMRVNVNSVKCIIDISKECVDFTAGVYVSTAYSNCIRSKIEEVVYNPPLTYENSIALLRIIEALNWSEEEVNEVTKKVIGKWPNTYTFTKAIAEGVVADYAKDIPFSIIRPSIVVATDNEPEPGWTDSMLGPSGIMLGVGSGALHVLFIDMKKRCDIVPCDMACMGIIASAWETGVKTKRSTEKTQVYNCVNQHPISYNKFFFSARKAFLENASYHIFYWPFVVATTSPTMFAIYQFFLLIIPALIVDRIIKYRGHRPFVHKLCKRVLHLYSCLTFFSLGQWDFETHNLKSLWNNMNDVDQALFPFKSDSFKWEIYFKKYTTSLKSMMDEYLVKNKIVRDKPYTKADVERHVRRLYLIHTTVKIVVYTFLIWLVWKVLRGSSYLVARTLHLT